MRNFAQRGPGQQGVQPVVLHRAAPAQRDDDVWVSRCQQSLHITSLYLSESMSAITSHHVALSQCGCMHRYCLVFETYID